MACTGVCRVLHVGVAVFGLAGAWTGAEVRAGGTGGVGDGGVAPAPAADAARLQTWYASRQAALAGSYQAAMAEVNEVVYRNARRTAILVPTKDVYGDPMYVRYGARAYAGTPWYNGPAYTASFGSEREIPYGVLHGASRLYWPGSLSNPGAVPRTDVNLGVGASSGHFQHGMVLGPGSIAPSHSRPMQFNRY